MAGETLYQKVVVVTYGYLGPAADRFVARQIYNHLNKKPEQLTKRDIPELIDWLRLAMGFLTQDSLMIEEYIKRLQALHTPSKQLTAKLKHKAHAHES